MVRIASTLWSECSSVPGAGKVVPLPDAVVDAPSMFLFGRGFGAPPGPFEVCVRGGVFDLDGPESCGNWDDAEVRAFFLVGSLSLNSFRGSSSDESSSLSAT